MSQSSPNIGLPLYDRTADKPSLFIDYRDDVNGTGSTSGFSIIDDQFGQLFATLNDMKGSGWTSESLTGNAQAIASLKEKGVYTAIASGTNALTATIADFGANPPPNNAVIILVPSALNTATVTISINSETARPLNIARGKSGTVSYDALSAKDLRPNVPMVIRKSSDGTRYILIGFGESYAKDVFYDNGNGTFTSAQAKFDEKLSRDGSLPMTGALKFDKGIPNIKTANNIAQYVNYPSATGTLKITLPFFSGDFMTMKILGYTYGTDNQSGWELLISGNIDGSLSWFSCSAVLTGNAPFSSVRMGIESGKPVILIGTTTTFWSYPHVNISEILHRGAGSVDGWTMAVVSSETGITVQKTPILQELINKNNAVVSSAMKFDKGVPRVKSYKDVLHGYFDYNYTGILKITMPKSAIETMFSGKIRGFQYAENNKSWELDFSTYTNTSNNFLWTTARTNGITPFSKVRFAYDGSKFCMLLGETTTNWSYVFFNIPEFLVGFSNTDGWETGWSAEIITSEAGLTNIVEAELQGTVPKETVITSGFASGWSGYIVGNKNQEFYKTIHVNLTKSTDITSGYTQLYGALPTELRPTRTEKRPISALDVSGNLISTGYIQVVTDGSVGIFCTGTLTNGRNVDLSIGYY